MKLNTRKIIIILTFLLSFTLMGNIYGSFLDKMNSLFDKNPDCPSLKIVNESNIQWEIQAWLSEEKKIQCIYTGEAKGQSVNLRISILSSENSLDIKHANSVKLTDPKSKAYIIYNLNKLSFTVHDDLGDKFKKFSIQGSQEGKNFKLVLGPKGVD